MIRRWSAPFHGVQHLLGTGGGLRVTVTDYDSFADLTVSTPGRHYQPETSQHETVAAAIEAGERRAAELDVAA